MRKCLCPALVKLFRCMLLLLFMVPAGVMARGPLEGLMIKRVSVTGARTRISVFRSKIALKENTPFRESDVDKTKKNLYGMKLFKSVEIDSKFNEALGGVEVSIRAKDGWFVFPLPFFGGGGGGRRTSLMIVERNFFRRAESLYFFGSSNRDGKSAMAGGSAGRFSLSAGIHQRDFTEYEYSDGGFNVTGFFRSSSDETDLSRYGTVINSYDKEVKGGSASLGVKISKRLGARLSVRTNRVSYPAAAALVPGDAGDQNLLTARISFGRAPRGGMAGFSQIFGAIFGLGLADVGERIKPLARRRAFFGSDLSVSRGGKFLGSDFSFTRISAGVSGHMEFTQRHRLSLRLRASRGFDLPFTQLIATNRSLGLEGNYAREYRGDTGAGGSLAFDYLLRKSRRGVLVSRVFAENGHVWRNSKNFNQPGAGASLYYRFWRFPLPLGVGYTYSLEDEDGQFSFAIGGSF